MTAPSAAPSPGRERLRGSQRPKSGDSPPVASEVRKVPSQKNGAAPLRSSRGLSRRSPDRSASLAPTPGSAQYTSRPRFPSSSAGLDAGNEVSIPGLPVGPVAQDHPASLDLAPVELADSRSPHRGRPDGRYLSVRPHRQIGGAPRRARSPLRWSRGRRLGEHARQPCGAPAPGQLWSSIGGMSAASQPPRRLRRSRNDDRSMPGCHVTAMGPACPCDVSLCASHSSQPAGQRQTTLSDRPCYGISL